MLLFNAQLVQHLDFVFSLNAAAIMDLFDARKIVEAGIAELAAQRTTDEDIALLEACLQKSADSAHDPELFLHADLELHTLIATIARNPILSSFILVETNRRGGTARDGRPGSPATPVRAVSPRDAVWGVVSTGRDRRCAVYFGY